MESEPGIKKAFNDKSNRTLKKFLFFVGVLWLPFIAWGAYSLGGVLFAPHLEITTPQDGYITNQPKILVQGKVIPPKSKVELYSYPTNIPVEVNKKGEFSFEAEVTDLAFSSSEYDAVVVEAVNKGYRRGVKVEGTRTFTLAQVQAYKNYIGIETADVTKTGSPLASALDAQQKRLGVHLFDRVSISGDKATITVSNLWHIRAYQIRLQDAQSIQQTWASLSHPTEPDLARIELADGMGNRVGGSSTLAGSLVSVNKQ